MNNIFNFATSELSQDAFICWCLNGFNDDDLKLRELSKELICNLIDEEIDIEKVVIKNQYSKKVFYKNEEISIKIDVLLIVNDEIAVIIEDKTYTGLHDDQLNRYKNGIDCLINEKEDLFKNIKEIKTVYFKTGFYYDNDIAVQANRKISGKEFKEILEKYKGINYMLDSYLLYLNELLEWYDIHKAYNEIDSDFAEKNIVLHQIAQYTLMKEIFYNYNWSENQSDWKFRIYHGTNKGGRPWTQMCLKAGNENDNTDFSSFWRIDADNDGPYLSLRIYMIKGEKHKELYENLKNALKNIVKKSNCFKWEDVYPGYRGNYKESDLLHIKLDLIINDNKDLMFNDIRNMTNEYLKIIME